MTFAIFRTKKTQQKSQSRKEKRRLEELDVRVEKESKKAAKREKKERFARRVSTGRSQQHKAWQQRIDLPQTGTALSRLCSNVKRLFVGTPEGKMLKAKKVADKAKKTHKKKVDLANKSARKYEWAKEMRDGQAEIVSAYNEYLKDEERQTGSTEQSITGEKLVLVSLYPTAINESSDCEETNRSGETEMIRTTAEAHIEEEDVAKGNVEEEMTRSLDEPATEKGVEVEMTRSPIELVEGINGSSEVRGKLPQKKFILSRILAKAKKFLASFFKRSQKSE